MESAVVSALSPCELSSRVVSPLPSPSCPTFEDGTIGRAQEAGMDGKASSSRLCSYAASTLYASGMRYGHCWWGRRLRGRTTGMYCRRCREGADGEASTWCRCCAAPPRRDGSREPGGAGRRNRVLSVLRCPNAEEMGEMGVGGVGWWSWTTSGRGRRVRVRLGGVEKARCAMFLRDAPLIIRVAYPLGVGCQLGLGWHSARPRLARAWVVGCSASSGLPYVWRWRGRGVGLCWRGAAGGAEEAGAHRTKMTSTVFVRRHWPCPSTRAVVPILGRPWVHVVVLEGARTVLSTIPHSPLLHGLFLRGPRIFCGSPIAPGSR
ncbi:hypothetical protein C8J57DRAFT_555505 [Mycena rebaudengoi]|nr:hypothetical protein C8J57DRAFT_555505 [Mycena rebaudengoi]